MYIPTTVKVKLLKKKNDPIKNLKNKKIGIVESNVRPHEWYSINGD